MNLIGRLFYVAPESDDMYYLRCLLNVVKGATCYEDLRFVNGVQHDTFRDAWFVLGLLDDDKEYIDGIVEASFWSSAHSLRLLFVSLLSSESVSRPDVNTLISDELSYDREALGREHLEFLSQFTNEQLHVHDTIMSSVNSTEGKIFFVYGYVGTGKTFIWRSLSAGIRSTGDSMCNIKQGSDLAELIIKSKLIIWDEAPMIHKHCIEAVDRTFRDILRVYSESSMDKPFGGKTIVFGSDFRQILHVVPKGSRQNVVNATINSSYLWRSCTMLRLTRNMRLLSVESSVEASKLKEFSSWVASIGDGVVGGLNNGEVAIDRPSDIVLSNAGDPLKTIVENIYPSYMDPEELSNCLHDRAILAPTLDVVDEVNQFMILMDKSQGRVYLSSDSISNSDSTSNCSAEIHYVEFLNNLKCSGTPNHEFMLKVGTLVMLLRNIDHSNGLCNGTRLIITHLGDYVLEARVLGGIILVIRF
ncbi:uncharacterized protein LOC121796497 [Salvia splendens]|uniref:uncharacterized protein LOC121796497 n=1 Tax=Salvia splendens TaxID=180675 RepID=UPI001C2701CD|nr:uncharacterized protein LOC121796497 [Salvia splendens]